MNTRLFVETDPDELDADINCFIKGKKVIDIKYSTVNSSFSYSNYHPKFICARRYYSALIMYEKPSILKQKTFDEFVEDDEINEFLKSHDVIKVEHFADSDGDANTVITYKESVEDDDC